MNYTKKQDKAYNELKKRLVSYMMSVQRVYENISAQASSIALSTDYDADSGEVFSFKNYPEQRTAIEKMQNDFVSEISSLIDKSITKEWESSNVAQNLLVNSMFESIGVKANNFRDKKYFQLNEGALRAFKNRKDRGMGLSEKIWQQSKDLQDELADAISVSIQRGMSAITLSKRISKYLSNFAELKRDYGEKFGTAIRTKDCQYHSIRLARTEINMSYRTAEQARWRQFDFVLGYRIKLSNNHTCKGVLNFYDICDELTGDYPKDFDWAGWHPSCRCYAVPILMSEADFERYNLGEETKEKPITEMPKQFDEWLMRNADRIEKAQERGTLPYFLRDNKQLILFVENKGLISKSNLDTILHDTKIFGVDASPLYKELNRKGATKDSVMDVALDLYDKTRNSPIRIAYDNAYDEYKKVTRTYTASLNSNFSGIEYDFTTLNSEKDVLSKIEDLKTKTKTFAKSQARHSKRTKKDISRIQVEWNKKKLNDYFYPEKNPLNEDFMKQLDCKLIFTKDNTTSNHFNGVVTIGNIDRQVSKFFKENVIYHEGGHYISWKYGWNQHQVLKDILKKHRAILSSEQIVYHNGNKVKLPLDEFTHLRLRKLNEKLANIQDKILAKYNISKEDVGEAIISAADTLNAITEGRLGWGHGISYFSIDNMPIEEFIAHAFEARFTKNKLLLKIFPELFDDTNKFLENFFLSF